MVTGPDPTDTIWVTNRSGFGLCRSTVSLSAAFILSTSWGGDTLAQEPEQVTPSAQMPLCIKDSGGAGVVNPCFHAPDGQFHVYFGGRFLEAVPASKKYRDLIAEACRAMEIDPAGCNITPMFAKLGHNAMAGACDGRRMVFFDKDVETLFGPIGARFAIFHEMGHHHCGHLDQPCRPANELEADAFAAAALREVGVSLEDTLTVREDLNGLRSLAYPSIQERAEAITKGWTEPEIARKCRP